MRMHAFSSFVIMPAVSIADIPFAKRKARGKGGIFAAKSTTRPHYALFGVLP